MMSKCQFAICLLDVIVGRLLVNPEYVVEMIVLGTVHALVLLTHSTHSVSARGLPLPGDSPCVPSSPMLLKE